MVVLTLGEAGDGSAVLEEIKAVLNAHQEILVSRLDGLVDRIRSDLQRPVIAEAGLQKLPEANGMFLSALAAQHVRFDVASADQNHGSSSKEGSQLASSQTMMSSGIQAKILHGSKTDHTLQTVADSDAGDVSNTWRNRSISQLVQANEENKDSAAKMSEWIASQRMLSPGAREKEGWTRVQRIVWSTNFECFFGLAIITNALLTGVETQYAADHIGAPTPLAFFVLQHCYAVLFLTELVMRLKANGCRKFYATHYVWAWLDTFIVVVSLLEIVIDIWVLLSDSITTGGVGGVSSLRVVRMIRITRIVRALRIQRVIRFISSLRILVDSIIATLRSLVWAMVLLTLIIYVFGVTFTQSVADRLAHEQDTLIAEDLFDYWGTVPKSMSTLFQAISGGESWRNCLRPLESFNPLIPVCFYIYVAFTYFAVLNVVTGVFCSSAIETTQCNPDLIAQSLRAGRHDTELHLKELFKSLDNDKTGEITIGTLETLLRDPMTQAYFSALGLDVNDAWTLFKLIDVDGGGTIEIEEFLSGCAQLRGQAKSLEVASIKYDLRMMAGRMMHFIMEMEKTLQLPSYKERQKKKHAGSSNPAENNRPIVNVGHTSSNNIGSYNLSQSFAGGSPSSNNVGSPSASIMGTRPFGNGGLGSQNMG